MTEEQKKQVIMHADFFAKCQFAIDNGFYLEAVLMEYAAIESRLESLCGYLEFPCNKKCKNRKDVKISQRIDCIRSCVITNKKAFEKSKLPVDFFSDKGNLKTWIRERDCRVHGLYKNAQEYSNRVAENKILAEDGLKYARMLYNEVKRVGRITKTHRELFSLIPSKCKNKKCEEKIKS